MGCAIPPRIHHDPARQDAAAQFSRVVGVRRWRGFVLLAFATLVTRAEGQVGATQPAVTITDLGPGPAGRILRDALQQPHLLVQPDTAPYVQRRGQRIATTLIVLDRTTYLAGRVEGDVIVVDADVFLRPGAEITGRVVAIGGGAYPSALAVVGGAVESFHDLTYSIVPADGGYRLGYQSLRAHETPPLLFP